MKNQKPCEVTVRRWLPWDVANKRKVEKDSWQHKDILIEYLKNNPDKWISGDEHQHGPLGVPEFSDGSVLMTTMRHWGGIMAEVTNQLDDGWGYVVWAFDRPDRPPYAPAKKKDGTS